MDYISLQAVAVLGTVVYASFFEWTLHRFFMHRPTIFHYPFRAHAQIHHQVFKADPTYHIRDGVDKWLITMAWWNYPLMLAIHIPFMLAFEYFGLRVSLGIVLGMSGYYFAYEYLHYCMHKPTGRFFESSRVFRFINQHHRIHHQYMHRNLNVVMPLADLVFGTLILKPKHPLAGKPLLAPDQEDSYPSLEPETAN